MAHKVDWADYNRSLKQRGSIAFWLCDDVLDAWYAQPSGKRGGQHTYSDIAISRKRCIFHKYPGSPTQRDHHVEYMNQHGRSAWEIINDFSRRLLAENFMGRFKGIIGSKLRHRRLESQKVEAMIGCSILNRITMLGTPTKPAVLA